MRRSSSGQAAIGFVADGAYEIPIRKEIRNRTIVHELDTGRQRDLWQWAGMSVGLAAILIFSVWQHVEMRRHGYEVEALQQQRAQEEETNRALRVEIESLSELKRIERLARGSLGFVTPGPADAVTLERVIPPARPDTSVVASR